MREIDASFFELNLPKLRWGVVGTGQIATLFSRCVTESKSGVIRHVLSRRRERAADFAAPWRATPWGVDQRAQLLSAHDLDALYIATPHSAHAEMIEAALCAGIPVLSEKPMTCSDTETSALLARSAIEKVPLIEGWMYRCHPQIRRMTELLRDGAIGPLARIEGCFGFQVSVPAAHRLRDASLGGGPILDVGGYPLSAAMLAAEAVTENSDLEIRLLSATGALDEETGVELESAALFQFGPSIQAQLETSLRRSLGTTLRFIGSEGTLTLPTPFTPEGRADGLSATLSLSRRGHATIDEQHVATLDNFSAEARVMSWLCHEGLYEPPAPLLSHHASARLAHALETWRTAILSQLKSPLYES